MTSLENYLSRLFQTDTFVLLNFTNFSSKIQNEFGLDIAVFRPNNTENDCSWKNSGLKCSEKLKYNQLPKMMKFFQHYGSAENIDWLVPFGGKRTLWILFFKHRKLKIVMCIIKAFLKRGRSKFFPKKEILFLFLLISRKKNLGENYVMLGIKTNCQG